jgi:hypothetical protein
MLEGQERPLLDQGKLTSNKFNWLSHTNDPKETDYPTKLKPFTPYIVPDKTPEPIISNTA